MYNIRALVVVGSLSLALFPAGILAGGGFSTTCNNFFLTGTTLKANCANDGGVFQAASLDLNQCIVNNGGALFCQAKWVFLTFDAQKFHLDSFQWWIRRVL